MGASLKRGSPIDAPTSIFGTLRELVADTPADSPLTMRQLLRRDDYRDLRSAKVAPGEPAPDFELPRHDAGGGSVEPTGETVRLSRFRGVTPVALIFGSYT